MWKEKKNLQCVRAFYAQSRPFNSVHLFPMCALSFICIKLIKKRNTEFVRRFWPDQIFMMHCYDAIEVTRFQQIFFECNIDRSLIWIVLSNMCVCTVHMHIKRDCYSLINQAEELILNSVLWQFLWLISALCWQISARSITATAAHFIQLFHRFSD